MPTAAANCIVTTDIGGATDQATAVAIQPDGKIVVAGFSALASDDFAVVRYNPDFSLDLSFGTNGIVTTDFFGGQDRAKAIAIQLDGKIVVAGHAINADLDLDLALARYNPDGSLDGSFSGGKVTTALPGAISRGSWFKPTGKSLLPALPGEPPQITSWLATTRAAFSIPLASTCPSATSSQPTVPPMTPPPG